MEHNSSKQPRIEHDLSETVFSCVAPYIHSQDLNSLSLVSRKWYEYDCTFRKHVTIPMCYSITPSRVVKRFPNLESLTLKGKPVDTSIYWGGSVTPWVEEIVKSFIRLREVCFKRMIVFDSDIETLVEGKGGEIECLRIETCTGFSTDGLLRVGKECAKLRVLCLERSDIVEKDGKWLRELALRNKCVESLSFFTTRLNKYDCDDVVSLVKNCGKSLKCLKIWDCHLRYLIDVMKYGVELEDFAAVPYVEIGEEVPEAKFPRKINSLTLFEGSETDISIMTSFANQLTKLDLELSPFEVDEYCKLIYMCPNLEVFYTRDSIGDLGLQFVGHICRKLRKIKIKKSGPEGVVSHIGLMALAKGCPELECLHIYVKDITNKALECVGENLKNLVDFILVLSDKEEKVSDLPLDIRVRALLNGCPKLEKLGIHLRSGGLTDVGLGYIGTYGQNLRYLNLCSCRESDAGLVELSKGCPKLQKLVMRGCAFSEQAIANFVLNVSSLRYLWVQDFPVSVSFHDLFAMARPFWKMELIKNRPPTANAPVDPAQQPPPSFLAFYSLAERRMDYPPTVIPLYPNAEFD